jgi:hypothetical protein
MPGFTDKYAFPYPTGTDRVMDGDNAIAALANAVEDLLEASAIPFRAQAGTAVIAGTVAANAGSSVAVTFAVGRFTATPVLVVTPTSNGYPAASHGGLVATGVTLRIWNPTGTGVSSITMHYYAVQMTTSTGPGLREGAEPFDAAYVVTCRTAGCDNAGEAIPVAWDAEIDGEFSAVCGVCEQPITETAAA